MCKCYKIRNDLLHAVRALILFLAIFSPGYVYCILFFLFVNFFFIPFSANALKNELEIMRSTMWISC